MLGYKKICNFGPVQILMCCIVWWYIEIKVFNVCFLNSYDLGTCFFMRMILILFFLKNSNINFIYIQRERERERSFILLENQRIYTKHQQQIFVGILL